MKRKGTTIRGRSAKRKGSRAEIQVRNMLRTIYPVERRQAVQRVPLSGAGAIKCDVFDGNDSDSAYEVKCQETLCIPDWWRQTKSQASFRTPVLVITQAYRPFYFIMKEDDWNSQLATTIYKEYTDKVEFNSTRNLMDRLAELDNRIVASLEIDGDQCVIISQSFYLEIKACIFENK